MGVLVLLGNSHPLGYRVCFHTRAPQLGEYLCVGSEGQDLEVTAIHDGLAVVNVRQAECVAELMGHRDGALLVSGKASVDDDITNLVLIDTSEHQGGLLETNDNSLRGVGGTTSDVDLRHSLPIVDGRVDGGELVGSRVFGGLYLDRSAGVIDDVDDLIVIGRKRDTAGGKKKGDCNNEDTQNENTITGPQPF